MRAKTFISSLPSLCPTALRVSGAGASAQEKTSITSRSHAAAAWHGVQLIPLQERSRAHRNDRHMMDLSAGAPHTNTTLCYTTHTRTEFLISEVRPRHFSSTHVTLRTEFCNTMIPSGIFSHLLLKSDTRGQHCLEPDPLQSGL